MLYFCISLLIHYYLYYGSLPENFSKSANAVHISVSRNVSLCFVCCIFRLSPSLAIFVEAPHWPTAVKSSLARPTSEAKFQTS